MVSKRLSLVYVLVSLLGLASLLPLAHGQDSESPRFYFGVDLSYANEMGNCGAVYRQNGEPVDPFALFADHGATLVRARLWYEPDWTSYSTLDDVTKTFTRAKAAGMATLLDIQYSDNWADPSRQTIPTAWENLSEEALVQTVYDYTTEVLTTLHAADLTPNFVQVGNETNSGMLKRTMELDWPRDAALFNAGSRAIRDFAANTATTPQVMLHVAQPENTGWWFSEAEAAGLTDFDVIGISYYPQWSSFSIAELGSQVSYLRQRFGKAVMVVETGYPWTMEAVDETADNILDQGVRGYSFTPVGQRQFMTDLTQTLISNGALGVVYWEPAWISTTCSTRWGQGSHWENATFFDFQNQNEVHEGIEFLSHPYLFPTEASLTNTSLVVEDETGDVFDGNAAFDLTQLQVIDSPDVLHLNLTFAGDVYAQRGNYLIYFDTTHDSAGATIDVGNRPITVADPFRPEYRLDIGILEAKGTVIGSPVLNVWTGEEWQKATFTGSLVIQSGSPSVMELQLPKDLLGNPTTLNLEVATTDRARIHTAADTFGNAPTPSDWETPVILESFISVLLQDE